MSDLLVVLDPRNAHAPVLVSRRSRRIDDHAVRQDANLWRVAGLLAWHRAANNVHVVHFKGIPPPRKRIRARVRLVVQRGDVCAPQREALLGRLSGFH